MKKQMIILIFLSLFLVVGCSSAKTELDKFKEYLKKKKNFNCSENICKMDKSAGNLIQFTYEFNFDSKTLTEESNGNDGLNTSKTIYSWDNNSATYNNYLLGVETNATYNFNTDEYTCSCNYDDSEYVETQCNITKLILTETKNNFETLIKESKTTYFNE